MMSCEPEEEDDDEEGVVAMDEEEEDDGHDRSKSFKYVWMDGWMDVYMPFHASS